MTIWAYLITALKLRFTPLVREVSRWDLGRRALAKCKTDDVPAVVRALGLDKDRG
ncbi:hypothetical protein GCM10010315_22280 [Streptomyces luteosporeus]|uniref:Uncharacterized protein n=1 Tax=Streptomyces luteosporeus TaxID=173856 RepID=A0ABN3TPD6_9ACTN